MMQLYIMLFAFSAIFQGICASAHDASMQSPAHTIAELQNLIQSNHCLMLSDMPKCLELVIHHACRADLNIPEITQHKINSLPTVDQTVRRFHFNLPRRVNSQMEWNMMVGFMNKHIKPISYTTFISDEDQFDHMQREKSTGFIPFIHHARYACPEPYINSIRKITFDIHGFIVMQQGNVV